MEIARAGPAQHMAGKAGHADPGQHHESGVAGDEVKATQALLPGPAHEGVARGRVPWGLRPRQTGHRTIPCKDQVLEVLADRTGVSGVLVVGLELVEEPFALLTAHLAQAQRARFKQRSNPTARHMGATTAREGSPFHCSRCS